MRNLSYKVGDVIFMTGKTASKGKGKQEIVTKITDVYTHFTTGFCQHRFIVVLPTTEPTKPTNQESLIRDLPKLVIMLTEKVNLLENEITSLRKEVREVIFTV